MKRQMLEEKTPLTVRSFIIKLKYMCNTFQHERYLHINNVYVFLIFKNIPIEFSIKIEVKSCYILSAIKKEALNNQS